MRIPTLISALLLTLVMAAPAEAEKRIRFSGYDFTVKSGEALGPGPNRWAASQVKVDGQGRLHLIYSKNADGQWTAAEIQTVSKFGYGTYEIDFEGDIGGQDRNVVFGFFNYPSEDVGPDATNEIDIEFARWGDIDYKPLNYTIWPVKTALKPSGRAFSWPRGVKSSTHRFVWSKRSIAYTSQLKDSGGEALKTVDWSYSPSDYKDRIASKPMSVFLNLWGFEGKKPSNGKPVEVIVTRFKFTPAE